MRLPILRKNRRLWAGVALTGAVALLTAGSGSATDAFNAPTSAVTVAAGGSAGGPGAGQLEAPPAHANGPPAPATTGSMGGATGALGTAQTDATSIVNTLAADFPLPATVQFAVAHFQDYPGQFLAPSTDTPYELDQALTADAGVVQAAVDHVSPGNGGDLPESYFRVFYEASIFAWEPNAKRFLIVLGDH